MENTRMRGKIIDAIVGKVTTIVYIYNNYDMEY